MDIYVDVLVIINCYICWLMLSATAFIAHIHIAPMLKVIATLIGGASSLILLLQSDKPLHIFGIAVLKLLSLLAIIFISFHKQRFKKVITASFIYLGLNILLGGAAYLTNVLFGDGVIYTNNGVLYFDISLTNLIVTTAFIYIVLIVISRLYTRYSDKNHSYRVEFSLDGNSYSITAVADTGNLAKDIFSGKPVIVCTGINLYNATSCMHPIPVPYSTIAGEGILYAVKPSHVYIVDEKEFRHEVDALVAGMASNNGENRAIFNPNIL